MDLIDSLASGDQLFLLVIVGLGILIAFIITMTVSAEKKREARDRLERLRGEAEEFLRNVYENKKLPGVQVNIVLKDGEVAFFDEPSTLMETRAYRVYGGAGTRIKGIYIGGGASESHQRLRVIDSGRLILTNQRLVFDGESENRALKLSDIISATSWADAIEVSSSRRQKSQIYTVENPLIWQPMIQMLASGNMQVAGVQGKLSQGKEWTI